MRVLIFISVFGHGKGGHFHSLDHISREIRKNNEVKIITIGPGESEIIKNNPNFLNHIFFNGINLLRVRKTILETINNFKPEYIHFFDSQCYNILRLLFNSHDKKIILNKCGGPNVKHYPYVNNLVLFSIENKEWFTNKKKYSNTKIHLIPNRTKRIFLNKSFQPITKDLETINFVRICRIGKEYQKSIEDSLNLINYLAYRGYNTKLYIIGTIEDESIYNLIKSKYNNIKNYFEFLTDPLYTNKASRMLYLADVVIGTGRGLMEASSLGKPILGINCEDKYPLLINEFNFNDVFRSNFSERNKVLNFCQSENLRNIEMLCKDKCFYERQSQFSLSIFDKYFNIEKASKAYELVYLNSIFGHNYYLKDLPLIIKSFYNFYKSSKNKTI